MTVKLVLFKSTPNHREVVLRDPVTILGRGHGCSIRLPDPMVSRRHCKLTISPQRVTVRDLGSANGTYVNLTRIHEVDVRDGDVLTIGRHEFTIQIGVPASPPGVGSAAAGAAPARPSGPEPAHTGELGLPSPAGTDPTEVLFHEPVSVAGGTGAPAAPPRPTEAAPRSAKPLDLLPEDRGASVHEEPPPGKGEEDADASLAQIAAELQLIQQETAQQAPPAAEEPPAAVAPAEHAGDVEPETPAEPAEAAEATEAAPPQTPRQAEPPEEPAGEDEYEPLPDERPALRSIRDEAEDREMSFAPSHKTAVESPSPSGPAEPAMAPGHGRTERGGHADVPTVNLFGELSQEPAQAQAAQAWDPAASQTGTDAQAGPGEEDRPLGLLEQVANGQSEAGPPPGVSDTWTAVASRLADLEQETGTPPEAQTPVDVLGEIPPQWSPPAEPRADQTPGTSAAIEEQEPAEPVGQVEPAEAVGRVQPAEPVEEAVELAMGGPESPPAEPLSEELSQEQVALDLGVAAAQSGSRDPVSALEWLASEHASLPALEDESSAAPPAEEQPAPAEAQPATERAEAPPEEPQAQQIEAALEEPEPQAEQVEAALEEPEPQAEPVEAAIEEPEPQAEPVEAAIEEPEPQAEQVEAPPEGTQPVPEEPGPPPTFEQAEAQVAIEEAQPQAEQVEAPSEKAVPAFEEAEAPTEEPEPQAKQIEAPTEETQPSPGEPWAPPTFERAQAEAAIEEAQPQPEQVEAPPQETQPALEEPGPPPTFERAEAEVAVEEPEPQARKIEAPSQEAVPTFEEAEAPTEEPEPQVEQVQTRLAIDEPATTTQEPGEQQILDSQSAIHNPQSAIEETASAPDEAGPPEGEPEASIEPAEEVPEYSPDAPMLVAIDPGTWDAVVEPCTSTHPLQAVETAVDRPLHEGARRGDRGMVSLFLTKGADVNAPAGPQEATPLHYAAGNGHLLIVEFLTIRGADPNAQDAAGATPLYWARLLGHEDVVQVLLAKGANPKAIEGVQPA